MKKVITTLTTSISVFILLAITSSCLGEQQKIESFIKGFNKSCPINEQNIRIEGAQLEPDKTIQINITLTSQYIENDDFSKNAIKEGMYQYFLQLIQNAKDFKIIKSTNATFHYVFKTLSGDPFTDFKITSEEYNAPQTNDNQIKGNRSEQDIESILNIMIDAIKKQLPIVDQETGIETVDCYLEDKTMVTVAVIPDAVFGEYADQEEFVQTVTEYMKELARTSMQVGMKYGVSIRYVYKKENGEIHADITIGKDDL